MDSSVAKVVEKMKSERKIFVSERHLQIEFILTAKSIKEYENYDFVPEYPYREDNTNKHIDLMVSDGKECVAVEFKYVLHGGSIPVFGNEQHNLRNHSAVNIRRYQCIKDIVRLEKLTKIGGINCVGGYLLLITNMNYFWDGARIDSASKLFDLKDKTNIEACEHKFTGGKDAERYPDVLITHKPYPIKYEKYYEDSKSKEFKYLIVEV